MEIGNAVREHITNNKQNFIDARKTTADRVNIIFHAMGWDSWWRVALNFFFSCYDKSEIRPIVESEMSKSILRAARFLIFWRRDFAFQ